MKKTKILVFVLLVALCLSCFAACNKTPKELVDARDYLYNQYKEFDGKATPADFNRVGAVMINGTKYPIEWTVEVKTEGQSESVKVVKNEDGTVTVDVDEKAAVEISYDLTATISNAKGKTITVTFHHTVPQFKELTYAEYYATEAGKTVVVKGVITAIISKERGNTVNGFYMQDQDGGYYVYGMVSGQTPESLGLKVGMTVRAAGEKDIYNGTHEIKDAGVEILDETITAVTPADYTEIFTKAAKLSDEALTAKQSTVVTLKGVTVKENGGSDGSYYYFELAGKKSYVRISSSACPLTKDEITAFKAGFESSFGKVGNVTGIISLYDGSFYLTPISGTPFTDLSLPVLSDADAVAFEKDALTFMSLIGYDGSYDLAFQGSAYTDVAISWALDKEYAGVSIADNKLVVELQEEAQTIKLVATIKRGEATDTKEFEVAIDAATTQEYLAKMVDAPAAGTYKIAMDTTAAGGTVLYFDGTLNNRGALVTTEKAAKAADVVVEAVEGKEGVYTLKVGDKYLVGYLNGDYNNIKLDTTAGEWKWNDEIKSFTCTFVDKNGTETTFYFGTYVNKSGQVGNTMSLSAISYVTGENASKVGVSQFVGHIATLVEADYKAVAIDAPAAGTYKIAMDTTAAGGTVLYFDGTLNKKGALVTTEKYEKAADVVVEAVEGKEGVYTLKVGDKYLVGYLNGDYNNIKLDTTAGEWKWNDEIKSFTCTFVDKNGTETTFYFGTYVNKSGQVGNTMSLSAISYVTGENASKVGVSQFVGHIATLVEADYKAVAIDAPAAGTYKIAMDTTAAGGTVLYFDGTLNKKGALVTTEKYEKAADVVVEAVEGKEGVYTLKVGDKYLVGYLNGDYNNIKLDTTAGEWKWNDEIKSFTCTFVDKNGTETTFYFGTYVNKSGQVGNTMSLSAISYVTGENASKVGVSQFVGYVGNRDFVSETPVEKTDEEKLAEIKVPGTVEKDFDLDENATWTVKSGEGIAISGTKATVTRGEEDSTVVITATIGEATKDFTIVVKAKTKIYVDADNKITLIIQDYAEVSGWTNSTQYKTIDAGKATISVDKGTNTGKFYTSGYEWRTYQNENPTITVEAKEGYTIVSVKITYTIKNTGVLLNGETQVASGTVITVNGTKIELTVGNTGTATNGQVKITAIEIVYAAA